MKTKNYYGSPNWLARVKTNGNKYSYKDIGYLLGKSFVAYLIVMVLLVINPCWPIPIGGQVQIKEKTSLYKPIVASTDRLCVWLQYGIDFADTEKWG